MPSKSYIDFLELLKDVLLLKKTHYDFSLGTVGRKNLGFLTRSATVMLCAAWERYNENLLLESIDIILTTTLAAKDLPTDVKKYLSRKVKEDKNEIYPIELADNGWRNLWKGNAVNETEFLHTPNSKKLETLFKRFLGLPNYINFWKPNSSLKIDDFIRVRGEIAHNGSKAKYLLINSLNKYIDLTIENAIEIDYNMSQYLTSTYGVSTWTDN